MGKLYDPRRLTLAEKAMFAEIADDGIERGAPQVEVLIDPRLLRTLLDGASLWAKHGDRADRAEAERDALREALRKQPHAHQFVASDGQPAVSIKTEHESPSCQVCALLSSTPASEPPTVADVIEVEAATRRQYDRAASEPPCAHTMHYHVIYKPEEARCANRECDAVIDCLGHIQSNAPIGAPASEREKG